LLYLARIVAEHLIPRSMPTDRRKVLRHHPDKKAGSGDSNNDSFFKCIQKGPSSAAAAASRRPLFSANRQSSAAHESLTSLDRRRQFDSVDWEIEDAIPNPASVPAGKYVATFGPIFEREGRFSKRQPVPAFGTDASSKQEVEGFYDFWYKFDSWRSFEWWDKEANEGSDSCVLPVLSAALTVAWLLTSFLYPSRA
jgi:DnaJ family protein C protein 2